MSSAVADKAAVQWAPGAAPGTLRIDPAAPKPRISALVFTAEAVLKDGPVEAGELAALGGQGIQWINVDGLGDAEVLQQVAGVFGMHPLVLEDVVHTHQRPKLEQYDDASFIVLRMPLSKDSIETEQVSLYLRGNTLVTFQETHRADCLEPVRERIRRGKGRIRNQPADYLAYSIIDAIVDNYYPTIESYGDWLEEMEVRVLSHEGLPVRHLHEVRHDLLHLQRVLRPMTEVLSDLQRGESEQFSDATMIYLRDSKDHVVQLLDTVSLYRELSADLFNVHLSQVSYRTGEIMRVLTIIATIFIPLTFIAGVYGMNFDPSTSPWNMPELRWVFGYPFSLGLMLLTTLGLLWFFKRRGWLGARSVGQGDLD